jgi:hypothetical protein
MPTTADYQRARAALIALHDHAGRDSAELIGVLHTLLDQNDGWSHTAMLAARTRAETLLGGE